MSESKTTSLYLTQKALERLDLVRGHYYSRSKAVSLLLEGQAIAHPENADSTVNE